MNSLNPEMGDYLCHILMDLKYLQIKVVLVKGCDSVLRGGEWFRRGVWMEPPSFSGLVTFNHFETFDL